MSLLVCVQEGLTALMRASDSGHKDVVKSLLAGNANPNITDKVVWVNWCILTIFHCLCTGYRSKCTLYGC